MNSFRILFRRVLFFPIIFALLACANLESPAQLTSHSTSGDDDGFQKSGLGALDEKGGEENAYPPQPTERVLTPLLGLLYLKPKVFIQTEGQVLPTHFSYHEEVTDDSIIELEKAVSEAGPFQKVGDYQMPEDTWGGKIMVKGICGKDGIKFLRATATHQTQQSPAKVVSCPTEGDSTREVQLCFGSCPIALRDTVIEYAPRSD